MSQYCDSIFETRRWQTREVLVGSVGVGGNNPVRIQSMTTSPTDDITATVEQIMRLADAGCDIVRVTVQGKKEARACEGIKNTLLQKGYTIPVVADIHFYPPAAMEVIEFVDKVRINPGNFSDKRATFKELEYDEASYANELQRIEDKFAPLVEKCKRLDRAMRIGTNHGSLSDRIMSHFGDSPKGMVESALEYARICRKYDYHNFIFSMKASNTHVMIQAYRMLVMEMKRLGWNYPLHLGVTEAGEGEDGRVKSAIGIGALLMDGIGDTIRVSLTEDPWLEIDPCKRLVNYAKKSLGKGALPFQEDHRDVTSISRRSVNLPEQALLHKDGSVVLSVTESDLEQADVLSALGLEKSAQSWKRGVASVDSVILKGPVQSDLALKALKDLSSAGVGVLGACELVEALPVKTLKQAVREYRVEANRDLFIPGLPKRKKDGLAPIAVFVSSAEEDLWEYLDKVNPLFVLFRSEGSSLHETRRFFDWMQSKELKVPMISCLSYSCDADDLAIQASVDYGTLLCDGIGDGVCIDSDLDIKSLCRLSFNILQGCRMRASKTEYISCPSCGRTLFDLQEVTRRIHARTSHLPGVKIAVMGCIVNGPGEMADAHFGYVGSRKGMIDLYVGRDCVQRNIPEKEACDALVALLKEHGAWQDPVHTVDAV